MRYNKLFILGIVFLFCMSSVSADLTTGVVAYWKFDGNATDSHSSYDLNIDGAINNESNGFINAGFGFDGVNDNLYLQSDLSLFETNSGTWNIWVKNLERQTTSVQYKHYEAVAPGDNWFELAYVTQSSTSGYYKVAMESSNIFRFTIGSSSSMLINDENWHMITISSDGVTVKLYLDGVLKASNINSYWLNDFTGTGLTRLVFGGRRTGLEFLGNLDEPAYWNKALSDGSVSIGQQATGEIAELYNLGNGFQYPFTPVSVNDCEYLGSDDWVINQSCTIENNYTIESGKNLFILGNNTVFVKSGVIIN